MRLDPVYVLAPKPKPPSIPTRRAFLFAGGTFLAGLSIGGACGYAAGVRSAGGSPAGEEGPKLPPSSGDAELDELRRLALVAPIEELVANWSYFLDEFALSYRNDTHLPEGVLRLAGFVESNVDYEQRKLLARVLIDTINRGESHLRDRCAFKISSLERVR